MASDSANDRRVGLHPALSARQGFALLEESVSVRNLLRPTIDAVREMQYISTDGDSVFTLGSIGVEKVMKVVLGCKAVSDSGAWPTKGELIRWGHDIESLNDRLLDAIAAGVAQTTANWYAILLSERIQHSTVIPRQSGRFHHLDILATDQPGDRDQPSEYWERVEQHVRETRSEFRDVPFGDNSALNDYQKRLRGFIADELEAWWFCIHRLGVQGCFGELGRKIDWDIWDRERPAPNSVPA